MRNSWIGMMVVAGMMSGCGGGGAGNNGSAAQEAGQAGSQTTYVAASSTVGDYYTWEIATRDQGSTVDSYEYTTRSVRSVAADGAISADYLYDYISAASPLAYASSTISVSLDKLGRWVGTTTATCMGGPNPPIYNVAPNTIAAGMSWQSSGIIQSKCSLDAATQRTFAIQDNVLPMEQVTVPAGTFNVLKVVRNATEEDSNLIQRTEQTCWWEPDLGIEVKCASTFTNTNKSTGAVSVRSGMQTLRGYSKQKLGRKLDTELRFMGNWRGSFNGVFQGQNVSGMCSLMIDGGNINGNCAGATLSFNISGNVRADGALAFTASENGNTGTAFIGRFDSLQQMSGSWSTPNYGSGSWVMTQD
jgi:hypothetical protein